MHLRLPVVVALGVLLIACNPRPERASTPMASEPAPQWRRSPRRR
jgi:hypothetical protein